MTRDGALPPRRVYRDARAVLANALARRVQAHPRDAPAFDDDARE